MRPLLTVELDRFPLDHPLVNAAPDGFALRRQAPEAQPVDPRTAMPATGEALVRLNRVASGDAIFNAIAAALGELVRLGAAGFRFGGPQAAQIPWLGDLIAGLRKTAPGLVFIAGPLGDSRDKAIALVGAGCDALISSFAWWDARSPWLAEELDTLAPAGSVLCEIAAAQAIPLQTRLDVVRALGCGVIVPLALASQVSSASRTMVDGSRHPAALRHVSSRAAPVTAILATTAADWRNAHAARLILINTSSDPQPVPAISELASLAAAFDFACAGAAMLELGEVRVLNAERAKPVVRKRSARVAPSAQASRLVVESITPAVDGGHFAAKRVVGDTVDVEATIFADGHEQLAAELRWRALDESKWRCAPMEELPNDKWRAQFAVHRLGRHEFVVEGWLDRFGGFRRDFRKKLDAGVAQEVDHAEGRALVEQAVGRTKGKLRSALEQKLAALEKASGDTSAGLLLDDQLAALMDEADDRPHRLCSSPQPVDAERIEARFSSWYELFPRSMTPVPEHGSPARHGTFADVIEHLPRVRDMGFDTLYFPPIHPIGTTNRKGPNNTLTPEPGDPGSPYAIGGKEGGHDAIHPELGTFADFDRLVAAAHEHGLEIALDFAIQASPDHPWLKEHPGWFAWRPDGSMKYAENPPKKYQDIVNVDFYAPDAVPALWEALRDVILTWIDHGVKTFRVDNPHTKPLPFWEWLIADVRARHPDAIFLSEAFTRPTMMYRLAKVGFSQSYTYFTWRDSKHELAEYITELTTEAPREFYRPHFFVNTPDINPFFLQSGGRAAHRIRAVLAATLSGLWGVYSGFELCDARPLGAGQGGISRQREVRDPPARMASAGRHRRRHHLAQPLA